MTRLCNNCGFVNQDDYDFCAKCGKPLVEGVQPRNFIVYKSQEPPVNNKAIIAAYLITILLSWSGFIFKVIFKDTRLSAVTFFGFFMPFYIVQSKNPTLRKHGFIMLIISLIGVGLSFYVMLR